MSRHTIFWKLVDPVWLHDRTKSPRSGPDLGGEIVLLHVNSGMPEEYQKGHIPGAIYLDTNKLESTPTWNRLPDEELENVMLILGITSSSTVVMYGCEHKPAANEISPQGLSGGTAAMRAAVILMYAGVEDVRILDGGLDTWIAGGYELETSWQHPVREEDFGIHVPAFPDYLIDTEQVKTLLNDKDCLLVDMRGWAEFTGEHSGYEYIQAKGRIAGAVWGYLSREADWMLHFRNSDSTMRAGREIASMWRDAGITPDKHVFFYCGTGWRASEAFYYAYLMGWKNISVYDGGWREWSQDESNPTESGIPNDRYNP